MAKEFHQVPVAVVNIPKIAIITMIGLLEYVRLSFGLRNSAQTFQQLMDRIFSFIELDNILVDSRFIARHLSHLAHLAEGRPLHQHRVMHLCSANCGIPESLQVAWSSF